VCGLSVTRDPRQTITLWRSHEGSLAVEPLLVHPTTRSLLPFAPCRYGCVGGLARIKIWCHKRQPAQCGRHQSARNMTAAQQLYVHAAAPNFLLTLARRLSYRIQGRCEVA
jgi:hypothetical protein